VTAPKPIIDAEIVFLSKEEGGRTHRIFEGYRPHIVIQSRSIRVATYDERGMGNEHYLGVRFLRCPAEYTVGTSANFTMELMHHPRVDYSTAVTGQEFTVREGGRVIGHGEITARHDSPNG
jgi:translation elongation factor EF-Tu-like GTPase